MHSRRRSRAKILFEVLCALALGASFVAAWYESGTLAFLGSAFLFTLFGFYWLIASFARAPEAAPHLAAAPAEAVMARVEADLEAERAIEAPSPAVQRMIASEPVAATQAPSPAVDEMIASEPAVAFEAPLPAVDEMTASEPVAAIESPPPERPKPKRRARKAKPAEPVTETAIEIAQEIAEEIPEPVYEEAPQIEQLFDPPTHVRHLRPTFGRRSGFGAAATKTA